MIGPLADLTFDELGVRRTLRRATLAVAFTLGVPLLILLGLVLLLLQSADRVERSDRVIAKVTEAEKLFVSMQTAFRGYRLSQDSKFLRSYKAARDAIDREWIALSTLVAESSNQSAKLRQSRDAAEVWLNFVDAELADIKAGRARANDPTFLIRGSPLFDASTAPLSALIDDEKKFREQRDARLKMLAPVLLSTLGLAALLGIPALAVWLHRLLERTISAYRVGLSAMTQQAAELQVTLLSIGDAVVATDERGAVTFLNPVAERLTGWDTTEARGRPLTEIFDIFNEETGLPADNPVERVLRENTIVGLANHTVLRSRSGAEYPIEDSAAPIRDAAGDVRGVILVFHDVTDSHASQRRLQASEHRLRFLNQLGDQTRLLVDANAILEVTTRMLGEHMRTSRCAYADVELDGDRFTIPHDYTDGCESTKGTYALSLFGPRAATDMHAGRTIVFNDVDVDLVSDAGLAMFNAIGVKAIICCPLVKKGHLRAMMAVHHTTARKWTEAEILLVEEVVERCWATIERARAEADSRERGRLSELRADIAGRLDGTLPLDQTLKGCCELLVKHLDAAFARIWTLDSEDPATLRLRASAGLYTHLDGPHARVPVGQFKIGRIAENQKTLLTNDVAHDPNISDPEWAQREGMVAFAGYPLLVDGRVLGVVAVFARHRLSEAVLIDLAPISKTIAHHLERRRTEAVLRAEMLKSETAAERFRLLSEVLSLQVWTADIAGGLDFANQECVSYFGAGNVESDILGDGWAQYVHPEDLPNAVRSWGVSLASGERYEVEFRLRRADGQYRWFLVRAEAMRAPAGQTLRWFGTNTDIHDLKLAQDAAERASRAKDAFLAALSHELRTPLTPVLMAAVVLRDDERLPPDVRESLGMMERNIALEARLIDDLLDLTSVAQGKLRLRLQPCDAHSLIGLAIEIVRDDALGKKITLERGFDAARSGLVADPARFQQVIWNLLRNAVKFTPTGGHIAIRTRNDSSDRFRIDITDSGLGISAAALGQIFRPFDQGDLAGDHQFGGLGLGLSIAQAIVHLHGGTLSVESPGSNLGATFTVDLPGATDLSSGVASRNAATGDPREATHSTAAGHRLLLVEDHDDSRIILTRMLAADGYHVTAAATVREALEAAIANPFDLVISDLGLPDGTGNELMEQLRDNYALRGIALSGYGMEEDRVRSERSGFVTHLTKPVDLAQLRRAVAQILGTGS